MAQRPGFPPAGQPPAVATSIGNAHCNNILKNFRQDDVVYALMTQLREKESDMTLLAEQQKVISMQQRITEQTNLQLKAKIDAQARAAAEKESRIALLEQKLAQERKGNGSALAEANLRHLTEEHAECKRILKERDDELSQLRPVMKEMKSRIEEYEGMDSIQHTESVVEELSEVKGELAIARDQNHMSASTIEKLEKKIKGKEWMIKSLQEESDDQRSRENHLLAHIKRMDEKIDTYEKKFKGQGVDVPMLLAKLKDYEVRTKDLQGQVRRLTNKKLNELVLRSSPVPTNKEAEKAEKEPNNTKNSRQKQMRKRADSDASDTCSLSFLADSQQDMGEDEGTLLEDGTLLDEGTIDSALTDDDMMMDPFMAKSDQEEDVLSDFLTDVKVGIQTFGMPDLCCAQRPSPTPDMASSPRVRKYRDSRSREGRDYDDVNMRTVTSSGSQ